MTVRRCAKHDLQAIATATGANLVSSLADEEEVETFEASWLGSAEEVSESKVGYG